MKKFVILFLTVVLLNSYLFFPACAISLRARAAPNATPTDNAPVPDTYSYACILTNAYFYERESDDSGLFLLPKSYFVKVLTTGVRYSYVQYLSDLPPYIAVYGYCKTSELTFVNFQPAMPYLYLTIDVDYTMNTNTSMNTTTTLGATPTKVDSALNTVRLTYVYYGEYVVGSSVFCYVQRDGEFGYLPKTMDVAYPLNREYSDQSVTDPEQTNPNPVLPALEDNTVILFFSVIALLAAGLGYFLLKPKNQE